MSTSFELFAKVREYIEQRCSLGDLAEWLAPRAGDYLSKRESEASALATAILLGVLEVPAGVTTEVVLRQKLRKGKVPDFRHDLMCPLCNEGDPYRSSAYYPAEKHLGFTYVCRNCFLTWEQLPGDAPNLLSNVEDAKKYVKTKVREQNESKGGLRCPFCRQSRPYRSPPKSNYVYVCQNCMMSWKQKPGGEITLGSSIEGARIWLEANEAKKRGQRDANARASKSAYAQWWSQTRN